jgi:hypothetical protein
VRRSSSDCVRRRRLITPTAFLGGNSHSLPVSVSHAQHCPARRRAAHLLSHFRRGRPYIAASGDACQLQVLRVVEFDVGRSMRGEGSTDARFIPGVFSPRQFQPSAVPSVSQELLFLGGDGTAQLGDGTGDIKGGQVHQSPPHTRFLTKIPRNLGDMLAWLYLP